MNYITCYKTKIVLFFGVSKFKRQLLAQGLFFFNVQTLHIVVLIFFDMIAFKLLQNKKQNSSWIQTNCKMKFSLDYNYSSERVLVFLLLVRTCYSEQQVMKWYLVRFLLLLLKTKSTICSGCMWVLFLWGVSTTSLFSLIFETRPQIWGTQWELNPLLNSMG